MARGTFAQNSFVPHGNRTYCRTICFQVGEFESTSFELGSHLLATVRKPSGQNSGVEQLWLLCFKSFFQKQTTNRAMKQRRLVLAYDQSGQTTSQGKSSSETPLSARIGVPDFLQPGPLPLRPESETWQWNFVSTAKWGEGSQ